MKYSEKLKNDINKVTVTEKYLPNENAITKALKCMICMICMICMTSMICMIGP